eukprot:1238199-Amphidinium_carterae.1
MQAATSHALQMLENIRTMNPFPGATDDPPAPSVVNKDAAANSVVFALRYSSRLSGMCRKLA